LYSRLVAKHDLNPRAKDIAPPGQQGGRFTSY
jgi:hypothetical protein